jgi:hypothetical protein
VSLLYRELTVDAATARAMSTGSGEGMFKRDPDGWIAHDRVAELLLPFEN